MPMTVMPHDGKLTAAASAAAGVTMGETECHHSHERTNERKKEGRERKNKRIMNDDALLVAAPSNAAVLVRSQSLSPGCRHRRDGAR